MGIQCTRLFFGNTYKIQLLPFNDILEITTQHCNDSETTEIPAHVIIKERDTKCLCATLAFCLRTRINITLYTRSNRIGSA